MCTSRRKKLPSLRDRILPLLMILTVGINAACECGFRMSDTGQYFTHIIYTNFSRLASTKTLASNPEFKRNWAIQKWNMPAVNWATPLPIHNQEQNVYLENGNMVLRQVGYPKEGILVGRNVSIASVAGLSNDVLHGSFRTEMKIEGANGGSVGAFFWYHDDSNEIDIEILLKEAKREELLVHYTTQPSLGESGDVIRNATAAVPIKGDNPTRWFQRHRFDWTARGLRFYQNDSLVHANNIRVPDVAGRPLINLWADGGLWSGTPSITNVYMRVKYVVIYHNTSTSDRGLDLEFTARCAKAGGPTDKTICTDVTVESGEVEPSSLGAALLTPLPFWALSLAWIALGIWFL